MSFILYPADHFDPEDIFRCGQAFHWEERNGEYIAVHKNHLIGVERTEDGLLFRNTDQRKFESVWKEYFDLSTDYRIVEKVLGTHPVMKKALRYGNGIRILRQDPFETIITFIISSNSHIPRIMKTVKTMSKKYGEKIGTYRGTDYYAFPRPNVLAEIPAQILRKECKVGYRDRYIEQTSKMIAADDSFFRWGERDTATLRKTLLALPGVGPKVVDCILLFAYHRTEVFPVDVWMKRAMEVLYFKEKASKKETAERARKIFGPFSGYAQQYLFYYGRDHKIGVDK